jgi:hypothetical protein
LLFAGEHLIDVRLYKHPRYYGASLPITIKALCDPSDIGCAVRDPRIDAFLDWMNDKGYNRCIVDAYEGYFGTPQGHAQLLTYISERAPERRLSRSMVIDFIDVIPTDDDSTFTGLGAGEGKECQSSPRNSSWLYGWPDWCTEVHRTDYASIEEHLSRTFGIDITLNYRRLEINYADTLGEPSLVEEMRARRIAYRFPRLGYYEFEQSFARHSLVHYAIESYNGRPVSEKNTGGWVASYFIEPYDPWGMAVYAHELGHSYGLPHTFLRQPDHPSIPLQLEGIMSSTYMHSSAQLIDPLGPLERYALQPEDGYVDQATFAADYNRGLRDGGVIPASCSSDDK